MFKGTIKIAISLAKITAKVYNEGKYISSERFMDEKMVLQSVLAEFPIEGEVLEVERYGEGHINHRSEERR